MFGWTGKEAVGGGRSITAFSRDLGSNLFFQIHPAFGKWTGCFFLGFQTIKCNHGMPCVTSHRLLKQPLALLVAVLELLKKIIIISHADGFCTAKELRVVVTLFG